MSLFSKIKNAKKAADEHKRSSLPPPAVEEKPKVAYKHVPTHAGSDSLNLGGGTGMTSTELRSRIREENRRRSDLLQSGSSIDVSSSLTYYGMPGMPRSKSDVSIASSHSGRTHLSPPSSNRDRMNVYRSSSYGYGPMRSGRNSSSNSLASVKGKSPLSHMSHSIAELPEDELEEAAQSSSKSDTSNSSDGLEISTRATSMSVTPDPHQTAYGEAGPSGTSPSKSILRQSGSPKIGIAAPIAIRVADAPKAIRFQEDVEKKEKALEEQAEAPVQMTSTIEATIPSPTLGPDWNWFNNSEKALAGKLNLNEEPITITETAASIHEPEVETPKAESKPQLHERVDSHMVAPPVPESKPVVHGDVTPAFLEVHNKKDAQRPEMSAGRGSYILEVTMSKDQKRELLANGVPPPIPLASKPISRPVTRSASPSDIRRHSEASFQYASLPTSRTSSPAAQFMPMRGMQVNPYAYQPQMQGYPMYQGYGPQQTHYGGFLPPPQPDYFNRQPQFAQDLAYPNRSPSASPAADILAWQIPAKPVEHKMTVQEVPQTPAVETAAPAKKSGLFRKGSLFGGKKNKAIAA